MLAQLSQLPSKQYSLWLNTQIVEMPSTDERPGHVGSFAQLLQQCCNALAATKPFDLDSEAGDPVQQLLLWLLSAMQLQGQQQQQQDKTQQQQQQHPAEPLRQVLDVLLSALQYRQLSSVHE
jgi:hypothetical protein